MVKTVYIRAIKFEDNIIKKKTNLDDFSWAQILFNCCWLNVLLYDQNKISIFNVWCFDWLKIALVYSATYIINYYMLKWCLKLPVAAKVFLGLFAHNKFIDLRKLTNDLIVNSFRINYCIFRIQMYY